MKNICILGSTGSIGFQSMDVISKYPEILRVYSIAAYGRNPNSIIAQIKRYNPKYVAVFDEQTAKKISSEVNVKIFTGMDGLMKLVEDDNVDLVISAMVGFVGLKPTLYALEKGKYVALANKESVVVGGPLIQKYIDKIIPVDSEHSAIFQLIENKNKSDIKEIVITASGGPFWKKKESQLKNVRIEDALKHPVWKMGNKITIDSATLMNKALEIIEAYFLFSLPYDKIKAVIHPQSYIHSLVIFNDNNVFAHIAKPDMRIPITYALFYPHRVENQFSEFSFADLYNKRLEFYEIPSHFRSIKFAYSVLSNGGVFPTIMNASNEVAVDLFIQRKIGFTDIFNIVEDTLCCYGGPNYDDLNLEILEQVDSWARRTAVDLAKKSKIFIN
ncbi:MAG: 1-deoxy-D-xylulose-5-phosphate reductoisomerase [Candidatus Calescibacterium sp.]|nr:1-deoxy-D-xylulose-5-phosphate reductoisomerase [Candidatus Calescibacterium sp.]MDW8132215.1 1-deoxy-D-xylulose-5-phosphate reductoisomerase [Candidatus Calescibacterium sp.]